MDKNTSWESSGQWYDAIVGEAGHFYHQMIIPNVLRLLDLQTTSSLLDLGCGQGVLARALPKGCGYHGIDLSPSLIAAAKKREKNSTASFTVADICKPLPLQGKLFTHTAMILVAQNLAHPELAFKEARNHLQPKSKFVIVLNHPCFRIPRQSHWGIDAAKKLQYRRVDCYMSSLKIPIQTHPGKASSEQTISFHHPLSAFSKWLWEAGFVIQIMEEWTSNKVSEGACAKMENRARNEFPLFLTIVANYLG